MLYLGAGALVKRYIEEEHSVATKRAITQVNQVSFAVVGYTEARAAFARRARSGDLTEKDLAEVVGALDADMSAFLRTDVDESVARVAGVLAQQHGLRGLDAIHLAAALLLQRDRGDVSFLTFDKRLNQAASTILPLQPINH